MASRCFSLLLPLSLVAMPGCRHQTQASAVVQPSNAREPGVSLVRDRWPSAEKLRTFVPQLPDGIEPIPIDWQAGTIANAGYALDRCAFSRRPRQDPYCERLGGSEVDGVDQALSSYRRVFEGWVEARRSPRDESPPVLVDLIPPADVRPEETFLVALFEAQAPNDVCTSLSLADAGCRQMTEALSFAATSLEDSLEDLQPVRDLFQELGDEVDVGSFLAQAAAFYGVEAPESLKVQLLLGVPSGIRATVIGGHMVLPVPHDSDSRDQVADLLGVVVHEVGHAFAGSVSDRERYEVNSKLAGITGIVQREHENILDEATQTALGNVLFMNWAFPDLVDHGRSLYNYEPSNEVPWAIDGFARALTPILAEYFGQPGAFTDAYLEAAMSKHRELFGTRFRDFTRIVLLLSTDRRIARPFETLFPSVSRYGFALDQGAAFEGKVAEAPLVPRWLVVTDLSDPRLDGLEDSFGDLERLQPLMRDSTACLFAEPPAGDQGWRFVAVGDGPDALRTLLVAAREREEIVSQLCLEP